MRILWVSNFSSYSAYAQQSRALVLAIETLGHTVTVVDIGGARSTAQIGNTTVLPTFYDPMGNDSIPAHAQRSKADAVITLSDVWGFQPDAMRQVNWFPIIMVDHIPVPPACVNSLKAARGGIAVSRFGQAELAKIGIEAMYMPLGLDPAVWWPAITHGDQLAARDRMRVSRDAFLVSFVGVNDSNPSRKGIPELLAAWSIFQRAHRDAVLYLHTAAQGNIPVAGAKNGVDIDAIVKVFDIDPKSILMPDFYRLQTGIPAHELADMARASDVFCLPSRGEGFGVPLVEFQHAGCPIITTDAAAGTELCASGWKIEYESAWSWMNATYANPGIASITENLAKAYAERGNMARRIEAAHFARDFEFSYIEQKYLAPAIAQISEAVILGQKVAA